MTLSKENIIASINECIKGDEIGDCMYSRLERLCHSSIFSSMRIAKNDDVKCPEYYSLYRCWEEFYVDRDHTFYEFDRWIGSMLDMQRHNRQMDIRLILKASTSNISEILEISKTIFPTIEFKTNEHGEFEVIVQDLLALESEY